MPIPSSNGFFKKCALFSKGKVYSSENEQITEKGKRVDSSLNCNFEGEKRQLTENRQYDSVYIKFKISCD